MKTFDDTIQLQDAQWRPALAMGFLGLAAVLAVYFPLLSDAINSAPDGQFSQFFENRLGWSDLYIGGWPVYADPNSMYFYPLKYLFPATRQGLDLFLLSAALIFAYGNALLAWTLTRSSHATALALLTAPALGFFIAHSSHLSMLHAAAYTPWLILAGFRISETETDTNWMCWVALLAVSSSLSMLAGHPQITLYGLVGCAMVTAPASSRIIVWLRAYGRAALGTLLGIGLAAVFLIPAIAFTSGSVRADISPATLAEFSLRPFELGIQLFPYYAGGDWVGTSQRPYLGNNLTSSWHENIVYVGVCLPLLVVFGLRRAWARFGERKLAIALAVAMALAIAPSFSSIANLLAEIPIFSMFRAWARWQLLASVFALQLACISLARLAVNPDHRHIRVALALLSWGVFVGAVAAFELCAACAARPQITSLVLSHSGLQLSLLLAMSAAVLVVGAQKHRRTQVLLVLVIAFPTAELWYLSRFAAWAHAYAPPPSTTSLKALSDTKALLAKYPGRVLTLSGWQSRYLSPDYARAANLPSINWYGPLLDARFAQLSGITSGGWTRPDVLREENQVLDIYNVSVVEPYSDIVNPGRSGNDPTHFKSSRWQPFTTQTGDRLFVNQRALARVRLVGTTLLARDDQSAHAAITTSTLPGGDRFDAKTEAMVENSAHVIANKMPLPETKVITDNISASISVQLATPSTHSAMLVVGDNFSGNWQAEVDGATVQVLRVNYNQIGVRLEPGAHRIRVWYRDDTLRIGALLSLLSLIAVTFMATSSLGRFGKR